MVELFSVIVLLIAEAGLYYAISSKTELDEGRSYPYLYLTSVIAFIIVNAALCVMSTGIYYGLKFIGM